MPCTTKDATNQNLFLKYRLQERIEAGVDRYGVKHVVAIWLKISSEAGRTYGCEFVGLF